MKKQDKMSEIVCRQVRCVLRHGSPFAIREIRAVIRYFFNQTRKKLLFRR